MKRPKLATLWFWAGIGVLAALMVMSAMAPEFLSTPDLKMRSVGPSEFPPFGTDPMGIPLAEYALQGARIVTVPAVVAGLFIALMATIAGLARSAGLQWFDTGLQVFSEMVGALPRLVVILVVALVVPLDWRGLLPVGLVWALLASPGAMDEAAATAERLGGARFVEALKAHGFSAFRIYFVHIVWMNLRNVIARQAAEVAMQVVFLEISLSYLAQSRNQPSFTHSDATNSWASLLYFGYTAILGAQPLMHALLLGLVLVGVVAFMAQAIRASARAK
ncbi:MAG: hypothetical protein JXX28_10630 [Deltaproteobacteria bacterium]|nr:hypothetical protein [Deltaproteobacteria bacterium]